MLVLTRKPGEKITIGHDVTITVVEVTGNRIRLGIEAPSDVRILRSELVEEWSLPVEDADHQTVTAGVDPAHGSTRPLFGLRRPKG
jgi:carbon storage regulator